MISNGDFDFMSELIYKQMTNNPIDLEALAEKKLQEEGGLLQIDAKEIFKTLQIRMQEGSDWVDGLEKDFKKEVLETDLHQKVDQVRALLLAMKTSEKKMKESLLLGQADLSYQINHSKYLASQLQALIRELDGEKPQPTTVTEGMTFASHAAKGLAQAQKEKP